MTTFWTPSTCDCTIGYNDNVNWVSTVKKCRLHNRFNGQLLLDTVMAQNRRFNYGFPNPQTEAQVQLIQEASGVNKLRIRLDADLSNFDEHLPFEKTLSFFQNLKKILRGLVP